MNSKIEERNKIIDAVWQAFPKSKVRTTIHIIMENWADIINEDLMKENVKLKEEVKRLKNGR